MHDQPDKPLRARRRPSGSQPTDTLEAKEQSSVPPKQHLCRQAYKEKLAAALPAPLEPEPSHTAVLCKPRKAARSATPVSGRSRTAAATKKSQTLAAKKVRFAPGTKTVAEGRVAKPVRIRDGGFARGITVTKKDVRELELPELLGNEEYEPSLVKLKVRVGLLPAAPPSRPHAAKPRKAAAGQRPKLRDGAAAAGTPDGSNTGGEGTAAGRKKRQCAGA